MKKDDKKKIAPELDEDNYVSLDIASTTECTGMIPGPPLDDAQVDAYSEIYSVPQQKAYNAKKADSPEEQKRRSK
jgi:hypothetical protein